MEMDPHPARPSQAEMNVFGRSFGPEADAYDRSRPTYPDEAAVWLTGERKLRIVEIGAGTGLLTEKLAALGHDVIAVDPLPAMVRRLRRRAPGVTAVTATAERLPVRSRWADVVVVAQAFHWFDHDEALPEIARVLRPGGELSLVWNFMDESTPWVRKLVNIVGKGGSDHDVVAPLRETELFGFIDQQDFRFWQTITKEPLLDLVRSRSTYARRSEEERVQLLAAVATLYDSYGRGYDGMQLPYLTHCYRSRLQHHPAERPRTGLRPLQGEATEDSNGDPILPRRARPSTSPQPAARPAGGAPTPPPTDPPRGAQQRHDPDDPDDPATLLIDFR